MEEKKKKSFWKGRLGIGIIAVVAFMMLTTGSVYAYNFFNGGAQVTVQEAITWSCDGGAGAWDNPSGQWTVSMYPGETKTLNLRFHNASSVQITVDPTVTVTNAPSGWGGTFTCDFASDTYDVPAGGNCAANLVANATASAPPGDYVCTITISR